MTQTSKAQLTEDVDELARRAATSARDGEHSEAAALYQIVLEIAPEHTGALTFLGMAAFRAADYATSQDLMQRALDVQPDNPTLHQNLGMAFHAADEHDRAVDCFTRAISIKPDFAVAYFYLGQVLQESNRLAEAVDAYAEGARIDPRLARAHLDERAPPIVRELSRRAAETIEQRRIELQKEALEPLLAGAAEPIPPRLTQFLDQQFQNTPPEYAHPQQRPSFQFYPGLEPRPWYEREKFDWVPAIETTFEAIRSELVKLLARPDTMRPYVNESANTPELWRELAGSADWNSYHLWQAGEQVAEHCEQCPATLAALDKAPLMHAQGHAPEALFSLLAPGTHIPPHCGLANTRLTVHLPLIVPAGCTIRVGNETLSWREGRCLIFDDSFEHEVWNRGSDTRGVLIFEIWHPALTAIERRAIQTLIMTADDFYKRFSALQDKLS
jgi:aspartate beta-hydroxylase